MQYFKIEMTAFVKFSQKWRAAAAAPVFFLMLAALVMLAGCSQSEFKIKGDVEGADDAPIVLEKADFNGRWIAIDSTRTNGSGEFSIACAAPEDPEIYRLEMDGRYVYLPVDSVETITVKTSRKDFGKKFTLEGTDMAKKMEKFEKGVMQLDMSDAAAVEAFKKQVFRDILYTGNGDIMSYYVLTRVVDDKPLYDTANPDDAKYFSAIATAYNQFHPNDPRTKMLEKMARTAQLNKNNARGNKKVLQANEIGYIDLEYPDVNGVNRKLSSVAGNGRPTVVIFSLLNAGESPEISRRLREIYSRYNGGINFYEICFDSDITAWHEAAKNIGWTVVNDPTGNTSQALLRYNVSKLPSFYLINSKGELVQKAESFEQLDAELARL